MLKIRLKRTGKKREPHYRISIMESTRARDSKTIEDVGYYNPRTQPSTITLKTDRIEYWLSVGAQPTDTVRSLLIREGVLKAEKKTSSTRPTKKSKKKEAAE